MTSNVAGGLGPDVLVPQLPHRVTSIMSSAQDIDQDWTMKQVFHSTTPIAFNVCHEFGSQLTCFHDCRHAIAAAGPVSTRHASWQYAAILSPASAATAADPTAPWLEVIF